MSAIDHGEEKAKWRYNPYTLFPAPPSSFLWLPLLLEDDNLNLYWSDLGILEDKAV